MLTVGSHLRSIGRRAQSVLRRIVGFCTVFGATEEKVLGNL
jgi:hypothetical protein